MNKREMRKFHALIHATEAAENWLGEYEDGPDTGVHELLDILRGAIRDAKTKEVGPLRRCLSRFFATLAARLSTTRAN